MPLFQIPALTSSTYHDGSPVRAGDTVVPFLVVADANQKVAFVRGDAVTVRDAVAPEITDLAVTQDAEGYTFRPSGTVTDDTREAIEIYHVVALYAEPAMSAADLKLGPFESPRLYVNGNSWLWEYAVGFVHASLDPEWAEANDYG